MKWDISEDRPIWIQLKEQIVKKIVAGVYVSGEKLPTVRDLAKEAGVNPNTMQRALAALDQEGLVITNRTIGRVVTQEKEIIAAHRREVATGIIENFYSDMKDLGFDKEEAIKLLVQYK
ncbi:MAG: GntR family transcriptional regulator [Lachnospiraceae bacterium]|nr:GntR family transcriptional regulator [Lachnospiraceae bacterium]